MRRPDENILVVSLVEGPEILNGLKITRKFSEDGLQMVRIIVLFDINNDAVNYIIYLHELQYSQLVISLYCYSSLTLT